MVTKNYHGNYPDKFFGGMMYVNYIRAWTGREGEGGEGVYSVSSSFSIIRVAIATTVLRFRAF